MKLIVGLGNPGDEYSRTRHNIGRRLIEFMAAKENVKLTSRRSRKAAVAPVSWNSETVYLAHPLTYMNLSGEAVAALVKYWKIDPAQDLLIAVDDVALPFGKFRLRGEGSAGGHNGLTSIETFLGTRDYPRLRIGIGAPARGTPAAGPAEDPLRDYVLSSFKLSEEKRMKELFEYGEAACRTWALEPLSTVMSRVNAVRF
jgi:PTH1 family peptidyl-tRNA hydrolase